MSSTLEYTISVSLSLCVVIVFGSIFTDFYLYHKRSDVKKEKHSRVATGSMFAFYILYLLILRSTVGKWNDGQASWYQALLGITVVLIGTLINVGGRLQLKENWANHIKIYNSHRLITKGIYAYIRHPLYSSIMLMLYGAAVIYASYLDLLLVTAVFLPAMYYRALQEETLLCEAFSEYMQYQRTTGMFLPKGFRRDRNG